MKEQLGARIGLFSPQQYIGESEVMEPIATASPRFKARIAGSLYLIIILAGFFVVQVASAIVVSADAAATARNILAREQLYRLSLAIHFIVVVCNIPLAMLLYDLFKVVNRNLAWMVTCFILVGATVEGVS